MAGVTIHFTLGENGILKNAELAGNKYKQAEENETKTLNEVNRYVTNRGNIGEIAGGTNYKTDGTEFKTADKLDGKPIYAKYVKITLPETINGSMATNKIAHNIENIDEIWIDVGYSHASGGWTLPNISNGGLGYVDKNEVLIYWFANNSWLGNELTLLLRYTKTTD